MQVVYELPTNNQWSFDVQWCPRNPSLISSSTFDGHVGVYSLMGGGHPIQPSNKVGLLFPFLFIFYVIVITVPIFYIHTGWFTFLLQKNIVKTMLELLDVSS